jgi:uncharacterized glyoxalase superfamily protein PhnB
MAVNLGHRVLPCLTVADMRSSLEFYIDRLGFCQTGYWPIQSNPIRTEVRRDDVAIVLIAESFRDLGDTPAFTGALYMFPESVDRLAEELRGKVPFLWGPEVTDWDTLEFAIRDPNGYVLAFSEPARGKR